MNLMYIIREQLEPIPMNLVELDYAKLSVCCHVSRLSARAPRLLAGRRAPSAAARDTCQPDSVRRQPDSSGHVSLVSGTAPIDLRG